MHIKRSKHSELYAKAYKIGFRNDFVCDQVLFYEINRGVVLPIGQILTLIHPKLPFFRLHLFDGISQSGAGDHAGVFAKKLTQQGEIPFAHFTEHPSCRFADQIVRVFQQYL